MTPIEPDASDQGDDGQDIYAGLPWNHSARLSGIPGLVWYSKVRQVRGDKLKAGDWLDSLDHRGARAVYEISPIENVTTRTVKFSDIAGDTETVRCDVDYDVVDPNSQVAPDGTPVTSG